MGAEIHVELPAHVPQGIIHMADNVKDAGFSQLVQLPNVAGKHFPANVGGGVIDEGEIHLTADVMKTADDKIVILMIEYQLRLLGYLRGLADLHAEGEGDAVAEGLPGLEQFRTAGLAVIGKADVVVDAHIEAVAFTVLSDAKLGKPRLGGGLCHGDIVRMGKTVGGEVGVGVVICKKHGISLLICKLCLSLYPPGGKIAMCIGAYRAEVPHMHSTKKEMIAYDGTVYGKGGI